MLFAVAALLLAEISFRVIAPASVPQDFRLPDRTVWGVDEFVATTAASPGVRVAVVGDSVVWGGFADRDQTLSARMDRDYADEGRQVHSFNFGMNGAHANDLYPLVAVLAGREAVDLLVINFDYRFYRPSGVTERYPRLWQMAAAYVPAGDATLAPAPGPIVTPPEGIEARSARLLASVSAISARREYLLAVTLGEKPSTALAQAAGTAIPRLLGRPVWTKRPAAQLDLTALRSDFDVPPLTQQSTYVRYLVAAVRLARARGIPVVVFAGPMDTALLRSNDIYDPAMYRANIDAVRGLVQREGGEFVDLTDSLPADEIRDSHHPLPTGYARLARVLEKELEPTVRELESKRVSGTEVP
jgi:hypothetical protein